MEPTLAQDAARILIAYNTATQSHKRLPQGAAQTLAAGEQLTVTSGSEEQWTSRVTLAFTDGTLQATFSVNETLPARLREQAYRQQTTFYSLLSRPQTQNIYKK